jgi:hypothetical protein
MYKRSKWTFLPICELNDNLTLSKDRFTRNKDGMLFGKPIVWLSRAGDNDYLFKLRCDCVVLFDSTMCGLHINNEFMVEQHSHARHLFTLGTSIVTWTKKVLWYTKTIIILVKPLKMVLECCLNCRKIYVALYCCVKY